MEPLATRRLGRTGHHSSLVVYGGAALWDADPATAESSFAAALGAGVNHLDVAPQYGRAQELLGPVLAPVRQRVFVACKTLRGDAAGARAELEASLALLRCESFDLYQLHAVTDVDELERRTGALEAVLDARREGLVRFVGVTGHGTGAPAAHLEALRRHDLDTVMFPVNPRLGAAPAYRADAEALLAEADARDVGVMAIKAVAARPWAGRPRTATTWYEPYRDAAEVRRGVHFALSVPGVHALCGPGDTDVLPSAIEAARTFVPMGSEARREASRAVAGERMIFPIPGA